MSISIKENYSSPFSAALFAVVQSCLWMAYLTRTWFHKSSNNVISVNSEIEFIVDCVIF